MSTTATRARQATSIETPVPGLVQRAQAARAIATASEPSPLTVPELEQRRLVHRSDSGRTQADAFRELRTSLLARAGSGNFITLVAPVSVGCGGSFVARNLAAAFAFDESKTSILVDCDARHPCQHRPFGVPAENHGLMDYLDDPQLEVDQILHPTGVPRLRLIPGGSCRETTGEAFSSLRMRTLLDSLRMRYPDRYLILDGPAVQGSPDARMLADLADLVVLVAGYGQVTTKQVARAAAAFDGTKIAGLVFNQNG